MDFLDNVVDKAKEVFDVAYKKTNEVVNVQKQKFDISATESKRAKDFEELGTIYFDMIKDTEITDEKVKNLVSAIIEKNKKIEELKEEIGNLKNKKVCPKCSALVSVDSAFCNVCGEKLEN